MLLQKEGEEEGGIYTYSIYTEREGGGWMDGWMDRGIDRCIDA